MRNIILQDKFHQTDFNPSLFFKRFLELTKKEVNTHFLKSNELIECHCPACDESETKSSFSKFGMRYLECVECGTLRISPRPDDQKLLNYYKESSAEQFWREKLSKETESRRKAKIIQPRIQWLVETTYEYFPDAQHVADIYTNQEGYAEALSKVSTFQQKTLIHPFLTSQEIKSYTELQVISQPFTEVKMLKSVDVVTAFEVINRISNVKKFLEQIHKILKKDGLCFMTTILSTGFDLQVLWDKADNLFPPDWLNVFSVEGLNKLIEQHGFECLEFSTPGILDVEHVTKAVENRPDLDVSRFLKYLLQNRGEKTLKAFQEFLQAHLLSSYGRVILRKK